MRTLFVLIALFIGACLAMLAVHFSSARVLLILPPYTIQVSLNVLIVLALLIVCFLCYGLRLVRYLLRLPMRWGEHYRERKQQNAAYDFQRACVAFAEGRYAKAVSLFTSLTHVSWLHAILPSFVAQQYHLLGNREKRDAWVSKLALVSDTKLLYTIYAASFAIDDQEYVQARELLLPHAEEDLSAPALVTLLLRLYRDTQDYAAVLKLLNCIDKKGGIYTVIAVPGLRNEAYSALIEGLQDAPSLMSLYKSMSRADQQAHQYLLIDQALHIGYFDFARKQIEECLKVQWSAEWIIKYSHCGQDALAEQLEYAETCLKYHPKDDALLLCLGRLCKKNKLWGKAHQYLESALALNPSDELRLEFIALLEDCGEHEKARLLFRQVSLFHS